MSLYTDSVNQDRRRLWQHRRDLKARREHAEAIEISAAGAGAPPPVVTKDLVKGDSVAFEGDWHTITKITVGENEWQLDLGEVVVTASIDAEWRTKP